jgi:hypothetical protein
MADADRRDYSDYKIISSQIGENTGNECEKCTMLVKRLSEVQNELKTANLIMDLLLEGTENMGEVDSDTLQNISNLQISLKDKNWSQVQIKSYKKITQKCKDQGEIYVGTKNSFEVHPNQKTLLVQIKP